MEGKCFLHVRSTYCAGVYNRWPRQVAPHVCQGASRCYGIQKAAATCGRTEQYQAQHDGVVQGVVYLGQGGASCLGRTRQGRTQGELRLSRKHYSSADRAFLT